MQNFLKKGRIIMKRKLTLLATILLLISLLVGCSSPKDTEVLNQKLKEANTAIAELNTQVETAKNLLSEAENTIDRLESAANNSALVMQKVDGIIHISAKYYEDYHTDIPYYASANEAMHTPYDMGNDLNAYVVFQIDGLEKCTDVSITSISSNGFCKSEEFDITSAGVYVCSTNPRYSGVYTIEVSYIHDEMQNAIYFAFSLK